MSTSFSTALRNDRANATISRLGTNPTLTFYNGTKPVSLGLVTTQTALAVLTFSGTLGTVNSGITTFNPTTQNNATFVNGTPSWVRFADALGNAVIDMDVGPTSGSMLFTGTIANGVNVTLATSTFTEGNT